MAQSKQSDKKNNGANLGFEETLWQAADKMRGHMDSAEYKHVVLGLIFLKYISDAFEERRSQLEKWTADPKSDVYVLNPEDRYEVLEDRDEYTSENVFWVPVEARWSIYKQTQNSRTSENSLTMRWLPLRKIIRRLKESSRKIMLDQRSINSV